MALSVIAAGVGASEPRSNTSAVTGVSLDSRTIQPGDLYAALPGAHVHGAQFAAQARDRGAVAILSDPAGLDLISQAGIDLPVLRVPDPRAVLGAASALIYATAPPGLALVGVTGTNGKTTTAYLIESALRAHGQLVGLMGTVETRIGERHVPSVRTTPEATDVHALVAAMREAGVATCVMEVSSHALSLHRVDGLVYDVAVFTNLSQDHLDHHKTMENYYRAKADLFTPERARHRVICVDDEWGQRLAREAMIPLDTLSSTGRAAQWQIRAEPGEPAFTLVGPDLTLELTSALPGDFNRVNTALAALTLLALGHDAAAVRAAVGTDPHVPGRMERVGPTGAGRPRREALEALPQGVVDYAHTPDAVAAALTDLRPGAAPGALIVVLGAGGDRDSGKRAAMGAAAAQIADVVLVTDDNPRSEDPAVIRAAVLAGARERAPEKDIREIPDRREAIRAAVAAGLGAGAGAIVAVVGKGHERGQDIAGIIHPFDDRAELAAALDAAATARAR